MAILTGGGIATSGDDATLHGPYPRVEIDRNRERLRRQVVLRQVRQDGPRVEIDAMSADGQDDRNARVDQQIAQILHLTDASADMVVTVDYLADTARESLHVASGHPAVRVQPFVGDKQPASTPRELRIPQREKTADVDQVVLLRRNRGAVGVG